MNILFENVYIYIYGFLSSNKVRYTRAPRFDYKTNVLSSADNAIIIGIIIVITRYRNRMCK